MFRFRCDHKEKKISKGRDRFEATVTRINENNIFVPDVMKVLFTTSALGGVSWFGTLGQGHSF